ncbi:MAG: hypothetical protein PHV32_16435 [Eubacteriales bacterium]|nr:hypothetical protein [Eubacteriales bacterium]
MAVCKTAHRSFTFPHTYGKPFNAVKRSKREYPPKTKVMANKSAAYFTALYCSLTQNAVMAQKPHGSFVPERIRLPYTAQIRFLYQGTLGFYQPIKAHYLQCTLIDQQKRLAIGKSVERGHTLALA